MVTVIASNLYYYYQNVINLEKIEDILEQRQSGFVTGAEKLS